MKNIERAKTILDNYRKNNFEYSSNLMDTDREIIKEQKSLMKIFKYTKTESIISEKLAQQIINFSMLKERVKRLETFARRKSRTEDGILMFTYKVTPDYNAANYAEYMQSVGIRLLRVILNKKDNPLFDKKLAQFNEIYSQVCEQEAVGDYGVIFGYEIVAMLPLDEELQKAMKEIERVADQQLKEKTSTKQNNKKETEIEM